ncbi:MAG: cation acetate symporter [Herbaspirillum sp.]|jgi:cation/acetate symporter|nr:cation acetate symporter [Herbaspirillum sp.]
MPNKAFSMRLTRYYSRYTLGFIAFLFVLAMLEYQGMPRAWIGYMFMFSTIVLYASIGLLSRTADVPEYYVAGRRVPALFNGMATAADWISAATFISLAGGLYLMGFDGLAYIMGWLGGYCLVAFLIAPYLRKFGQYTVADFLSARYAGRYGGNIIRILTVIATVMISFTYVVAQIYGVGLITSRFTGIDFSIGIFLGLASILVCSFLGGMRAITWTQVAQYIIILFAYLIPVIWLSAKHTGVPIPQVAYGAVIPKLTALEKKLNADPREQEVRALFKDRANGLDQKLNSLPSSWEEGHIEAQQHLQDMKRDHHSTLMEIKSASRAVSSYPKSVEEAQQKWREARDADLARAAPPVSQTQPFPGVDKRASDIKRNNFMALVFCLMIGTASLPHILTRYYTTPSVDETRRSVFWTLFFIILIYIAVPALAVMVKYEIYTSLVGTDYAHLPNWVSYWANIDKLNPLVSITDLNGDHTVQLAEISIDGDILVLAAPEIAGLPYFISGLVAAGGLAAALSTADGLLLTISNALSHDIYYKVVDPNASRQKRVTISKLLLLVVALLAAYAASLKPGDILSLVGAAFSLAASTLFPVLVLGIFWKRANQAGAIAGIISGFLVCVYYLLATHPAFGGSVDRQWFHIAAISAGIFGVPVGILATVVGSLLTPPPDAGTIAWIDQMRGP